MGQSTRDVRISRRPARPNADLERAPKGKNVHTPDVRQREGVDMKIVLTYTARSGGNVADNVAAGMAAEKLLSNWTPSPQATVHEWVQRCDGNGGFAVLENDNAAELYKDLATWTPWLEFQVYPVLDILEATPITNEALAIAKSVV
jgi:hypothetical protein